MTKLIDFHLTNKQETKDFKQIKDSGIWYLEYEGKFGVLTPSDQDILSYILETQDVKIIPGNPLFLNQQGLSTQVPFHRTYFTNMPHPKTVKYNQILKHAKLVYTDQFYTIKQLQDVIKGKKYD